MTFTSCLAAYASAMVRTASHRRVPAAIANQISPCSPSDENRATARGVSEADAVIFGLDAQVDHLRQVEGHVRVACIDVVEALVALDRLPQLLEDAFLQAQGEHLAADEADVDACALVRHQCA